MAKDHIQYGTVPPADTPEEVGHHYIDTAEPATYLSVGTSSAADWQKVSGEGFKISSDGRLAILNESDSNYYELRCRNNLDGLPELFLGDSPV